MQIAYIMRVQKKTGRVWVAFDRQSLVWSKRRETARQTLSKLSEVSEVTHVETVRYEGVLRPSEAAMEIADVQDGHALNVI